MPLIKEIRRAILLSGTPALNKPKEIFQQVGRRQAMCWCIGGVFSDLIALTEWLLPGGGIAPGTSAALASKQYVAQQSKNIFVPEDD